MFTEHELSLMQVGVAYYHNELADELPNVHKDEEEETRQRIYELDILQTKLGNIIEELRTHPPKE